MCWTTSQEWMDMLIASFFRDAALEDTSRG